MNLSCECGNETEWSEKTTVEFIVDVKGYREEKVIEDTEYFCETCGNRVEVN